MSASNNSLLSVRDLLSAHAKLLGHIYRQVVQAESLINKLVTEPEYQIVFELQHQLKLEQEENEAIRKENSELRKKLAEVPRCTN